MIIRISALTGAGKSTLADALGKELGYRVFHIDEYRNKYRDEFKSLTVLFADMVETGDNFILDSSGFNPRILWVFQFLKVRIVDIKLICDLDVLNKRNAEKKIPENEYFPYRFTREEYNEIFFLDMERKHADITIDTTSITPEVMLKCAMNDLNFYKEIQ